MLSSKVTARLPHWHRPHATYFRHEQKREMRLAGTPLFFSVAPPAWPANFDRLLEVERVRNCHAASPP